VKSELEAKAYDYRVYDKNPDGYIAHGDILHTGDVGIITGIQGVGLLRMLGEDMVNGSLNALGIVSLQGYVLPEVAELCEHAASHFQELVVEYGRTCIHKGRKLIWINVERKA